MGCDGGTIPRRDELVRIKKKPEQKDKDAELAFKWGHCTIRQLPLQEPIVACGLGRLYSKESVLEGLLDRAILPESAVHIKSLKDIKDLNLTPNPAFEEDKVENGCTNGRRRSPYICPVIGLEMNGKYKFIFLWSCGCVMSERAIKAVKSTVCHRCQTTFTDDDIVIMNAEDEDLQLMEVRMAVRRNAKRKSKKIKLEEAQTDEATTSEAPKKKMKKEEKMPISKSKNVRVEAEDPAYKNVKEDYSIAKDPKASETFKSLFTSHKTAKEQDRAHWVTYNPFYN